MPLPRSATGTYSFSSSASLISVGSDKITSACSSPPSDARRSTTSSDSCPLASVRSSASVKSSSLHANRFISVYLATKILRADGQGNYGQQRRPPNYPHKLTKVAEPWLGGGAASGGSEPHAPLPSGAGLPLPRAV